MTDAFDARIQAMQAALLRILAGEEGVTMPVSAAQDELDALAHGIDILVQELNEEARQQRQLREEMDQAEADARVERRRAEEIAAAHMNLEEALLELRATQDQLIQAQKMEALGQLAGGLAHDFNNLLVVILSGAEQIATLAQGDRAMKEEADQITDAALRAQQLTSQLLTFARQRPQAPAVVEVNAVVERGAGMLTRLLRSGVDWSTSLSEDAWHARVDPGQLEQVIVNLSVNARDAMPRGGHLTVRTANRTFAADDPDRPAELTPGEYVTVEVADTGEGIPDHVLARMFDPFFTTKEPGKGTGLGLAICYGIVRGAGGTISVRTELGKGTCFTVLLPRARPEARANDVVPPTPHEEIVLLAEDEPGIRRVLRRALQREGFQVIEAEDGRKALQALESHAGPVDLLLTDVRMPGMGGPELARAVRDRDPKVRVLYISGHTDDALPPMEPDGREAFLPKPFLPREVVAKIRTLMGHDVAS